MWLPHSLRWLKYRKKSRNLSPADPMVKIASTTCCHLGNYINSLFNHGGFFLKSTPTSHNHSYDSVCRSGDNNRSHLGHALIFATFSPLLASEHPNLTRMVNLSPPSPKKKPYDQRTKADYRTDGSGIRNGLICLINSFRSG